jgi:hypothetical protein
MCTGFEILTVVVMKSSIFWDITSCGSLNVNRRFGGTYRIRLQSRRVYCAHFTPYLPLIAPFLLWLLSDPKHGGDTFLRNVGGLNYTVLQHRRWYPSTCIYFWGK